MRRLWRSTLAAVILWPVLWLQAAQQQPATTGRGGGGGAQPTGQRGQPQQSICTIDGIVIPCTGPPRCFVNGVVIPCPAPQRPTQQEPTTPGQVVGTGQQPARSEVLSGTVRRIDTTEPLPQVRLELKEGLVELPTGFDKPCKPSTVIETTGSRRFATSDDTGRFAFRYDPASDAPDRTPIPGQSILSGRTLIPEREGYVPSPWPKSDFELLRPITDVDMIPAPTISGRINDPSGRPLAAAVVQAWRVSYTPLGRTVKWAKSALSNDLGDFRLSWLPFGHYYVAAGLSSYVWQPWRESLRLTPNLPEPDEGLPMLFYPGVVNAANAGLVRVRIPHAPTDSMLAPVLTQALQERPRFQVRLQLVAESLPSNPQIVFLPYGGDLCAGLDYAIKGNRDGTFDIHDVPRGLYVVVAIRGRDVISDLIPVSVEKDIDDLKLPLTIPTEVRGTITFDSIPAGSTYAGMGINLDPANLRINLTRAGSEVSHVASSLMNPATGNFSIPGLGPGSYYATLDLPPGAFVKDIRAMKLNRVPGVPRENWLCNQPTTGPYSYLDGHGHMQALEIPRMIVADNANDQLCLNIEVSFGGRIMGRAVTVEIPLCYDALGCGEPGDTIVLLPESAWAKYSDNGITPPDRILTTLSAGAGPGRFEFRGLPPGDYKIFALRSTDAEIVYHPDFSTIFGPYSLRILYNSIDPCEEPLTKARSGDGRPVHDIPCEVMRPRMDALDAAVERLYQ